MTRVTKNLSLDPKAVERGERYSEIHSTSISQLVSDFLARLPLEEEGESSKLTPTVRRLLGVASGGTGRDEYREHLVGKYGQ